MLVFIDVDYFKDINDIYGYLVGDWVLVDIGVLLCEYCCQGGMVGCYGGEEFCVVFLDWLEVQVCQIVQYLLEIVCNYDFGYG